MAVWLIFVGCSIAALILCRSEWVAACAIWRAAVTAGTKGVKRLLAKNIKEEASLRVVLTAMSLGIALLATLNVAVNGPSPVRPNGYQVGIRLLLIGMPCVLVWKAWRNQRVRLAFADAAVHSDEFTHELHAPYMQALWDVSAIIVADRDSGVIVQVSDEAERLFGYPDGALLGLNVERLVLDWKRIVPNVTAMTSGLTGRRMDGTTITLLSQLVPVLGNSRVLVLASESTPKT